MDSVSPELIVPVSKMADSELREFLQKNGLALTVSEVRLVCRKIGRDPTLTELHIFNTEWSEHSSYKSSKGVLKMLPTNAPNVILGPEEDAGIIHLTTLNGVRYGLVIAHESHNHPSQVVPYEGAATGIGGIVRDVLCMGAHVFAVADPLRFGDPLGKFKNRTRYIANAVVDGIAGYGNPIGVPNIGGDVYFSSSFDDNCLVNVVCLGIVKEPEIIHSKAPEGAEGYDIVIVGKATDNSGFGGAAFASLVLDEEDREQNRGAVQVPDPFLKNVLIRATEAVFREVRRRGIKAGFKDMGAGGIMCSTSEMCAASGFGAEIDLDRVHTSMEIPAYIIACSETQERFTWIVPPEFTPVLLRIYNEDFELPRVAEGARASVVGKVVKQPRYILKFKNRVVCDLPVREITSGITYKREWKEPGRVFSEPELPEPGDYNRVLLKLLAHPNIASRAVIYKHYDTEVQGNTIIRPGEADAGLIAPLPGSSVGVALSTDSNPRYSRISPYWGAVTAVAEAMRNVACVGAVPSGITDCLNYGNPEKPEAFWEFREGVRGVSEAARNLWLKGQKNIPVPVVSGNVSFYNESASGKAVDPSAIIACVGIIDDYSKAVTMSVKKAESMLYFVGERKNELGGSVYYEMFGKLGANVPKIDFEKERNMIYFIIEAINRGLLLSCHDVSDGGIAVTLSEMLMAGNTGACVNFVSDMKPYQFLFSESTGFVFEVEKARADEMLELSRQFSLSPVHIGKTGGKTFSISWKGEKIAELKLKDMENAWKNGLGEVMK